jgi:ACS family glucarate transporter-like MFS transporter
MERKFPYRYRVIIFLFFLILITYLDRICIGLVSVRIKSEFHLNNTQWGWVLGAFALAYALFEIPSAVLGDCIGQRAVFIRIVLWWSLFTVLTGATTGLVSLIAVRFLFGMGESGAYPNSSGAISRWLPANETARGISWLNIGANAGAAIAPLIVIPIAIAYGWRASFFVNGFIGLLWVLLCFLWFRNHPSEMKGITNEERDFIEANRRFSKHHEKFSFKTVFKKKSLWALAISFYCSQWANYFFVAWMSVYLQEGRRLSENNMKMVTSYLFIVGIIAALSAGVASDWLVKKKGLRLGRRFMAMLSFGMMGILFLVTGTTTNNTMVIISLITAHFFYAPNVITFFSTCVDIGGNKAASVAGIMNFFGQLGAFFMAIVFGKIVDMTHSFSAPLYAISAVLFAGGLLWLFIDPGKPLIAENKEPL